MLEDATIRAAGAGRYRRGWAVVGLDAVAERATVLVAASRGLSVSNATRLEDW
jgi:hypothetical protein